MSVITWQTPAGSLGTIADRVFFTLPLLATTAFTDIPALCVQTSSLDDIITCDSTAGATVGQSVLFFGDTLGSLQQNTVYYVHRILSVTEFQVSATPNAADPLPLTDDQGFMTARFYDTLSYRLQAGDLPNGLQVNNRGIINGIPAAVLAGNETSKFTIRAFTTKTQNNRVVVDTIAERTFTITIAGIFRPEFITPAGQIASYYDGNEVSLQIQYQQSDVGIINVVRLVGGELPPGLNISATGLITGFVRPYRNIEKTPGYDLTASGVDPYDFIAQTENRNYQFTLEVTDGISNDVRVFSIFVYDQSTLTADDTEITADDSFVTADQTPERLPFLINSTPGDLGIVRGDNNFAYRFIGQDYDNDLLEYVISVNQGIGLPPGLTLDRYTGWYYGYVPDIEPTRLTYSFNIQVRARSLVCTSTDAATDEITCDATTRGDFYVGAAVTFQGTSFGGIGTGITYYVNEIVDDTHFKISDTFNGSTKALTTAVGEMLCVPVETPASELYPFTLTIAGAEYEPITWQTAQDLGIIENGVVSNLAVSAVSTEGFDLQYQLVSGTDSSLPQGLQLLPSGLISGRTSFNTFSLDLGTTTFDASQSTATRFAATTFDSVFEFSVEAYRPEPSQDIFKVSTVKIINGGGGFVSAPALTFNAPTGSIAVQATATAVVQSGFISAINITNAGAGYTSTATLTVQGGDGSGQQLQVVMQKTGSRYLISDVRRFRVRVIRTSNRPYQNLLVVAMPSIEDRAELDSLLENPAVFVPEFIYRPQDPYYGVARSVVYQHAFGLYPDTLENYVKSLQINHYWKNLVLGNISTAQARDSEGRVLYEVVYSNVIDDLVNHQGQSVSKIITVPYSVEMPDSTIVNSVYPNSLVNMRDQVVDTVGQVSDYLPLWMTSRQQNGSVLGFRPAWVICYTLPGRSEQIAYYIREFFGERLNTIDFKVDRYVLDDQLSRNWDAEQQRWRPPVNMTTFDRFNTTSYNDLGFVSACTTLAYADVNGRTIDEINALGGLDGETWIFDPSRVIPPTAEVIVRNGSTVIFVQQENFFDYTSAEDAFTSNFQGFDATPFDAATQPVTSGSFDYGGAILAGYQSICTVTDAATDFITASSTLTMTAGNKIWFTGTTFGGINTDNSSSGIQLYYVHSVQSIAVTATNAATDALTTTDTTVLSNGQQIWISGGAFGGISAFDDRGVSRPYYVSTVVNGTQFKISATPGGAVLALDTGVGNMTVRLPRFQVSLQPNATQPLPLISTTGIMTANYNNDRMGIYEITIGERDTFFLSLREQTITDDYVESQQGEFYRAGTLLYRPAVPAPNLTRVNWQPLITAIPVIIDETTFDGGSLQFVEPVDMYDVSNSSDKYLIFPKINILE